MLIFKSKHIAESDPAKFDTLVSSFFASLPTGMEGAKDLKYTYRTTMSANDRHTVYSVLITWTVDDYYYNKNKVLTGS